MIMPEILNKYRTNFSFEFFPPKTEKSAHQLYKTIAELQPLEPCYVSVTYGAGGTTRSLTRDLVIKIQRETNIPVVSHLTCVGSTRDDIRALLKDYHDNGIHNVLALRGDPPEGQDSFVPEKEGFANGTELVAFIRSEFPDMGIGVAGDPEGHPQTPNRLQELENLKKKVEAGADYICTQLFFHNHDFYDFRDRCELIGIDVPIVAGIMPVNSKKGMYRMADLAAGSRFPAKLLRFLYNAEDDEYVENVGIHWATSQVMDLLDNDVAGIHFYTLNKSEASLRIYHSLGVTTSRKLREWSE